MGDLGAFRFDGQLAAKLYQSPRARKRLMIPRTAAHQGPGPPTHQYRAQGVGSIIAADFPHQTGAKNGRRAR